MATVARPLPWARREYPLILSWLLTTDHKKIGILYLVTGVTFFLAGGIMALFMRLELANAGEDFINASDYSQLFTMHGTMMIFFWIIPALIGFGNYLVPLMIGARHMAFPRLNAFAFWMLPPAGIMMLSGFATGGAADAGWTSYPPLSSLSAGHGLDLWILGLYLVGFSSIVAALNFIVTTLTMRAPGMSLHRMPLFVWSVLVTAVVILLATPVLAGGLTMLLADRQFGTHFFDPSEGGSPLLWQHLFWFYSHPAVYVMLLPFMGVVSEILPVFSRKPIFGYRAIAYSSIAIGFLGFTVWANHMFTTGLDIALLSFFMATTMIMALPFAVMMGNWLATLWGGSIQLRSPMLFALGFLSMLPIGGISGLFQASIPVDFALHDTYWAVAHLHYVLFGGSVFAIFAGLYYWLPKMTGRMLSEALGKLHFGLMFVGFNVAFAPMYVLGLSGMPRRLYDYSPDRGWEPLNLVVTIGAFIIAASILVFLGNFFASVLRGRPAPDDPWEGNSLEWMTSSPPPEHNFDVIPVVESDRPAWERRHGRAKAAGAAVERRPPG